MSGLQKNKPQETPAANIFLHINYEKSRQRFSQQNLFRTDEDVEFRLYNAKRLQKLTAKYSSGKF